MWRVDTIKVGLSNDILRSVTRSTSKLYTTHKISLVAGHSGTGLNHIYQQYGKEFEQLDHEKNKQ